MYRFRKIENLLEKHQELKNQEIYFSDIDSLNDPMEGFRDFYWHGDLIVWRNFLKHYLLCLEHIYSLACLSREEQLLEAKDIPIFLDEEKLPTDQYRLRLQELCEQFFKMEGVNEYLELLAATPLKISRDELYVHLKTLHPLAFNAIIENHVKHGFQLSSPVLLQEYTKGVKKYIQAWNKLNIEDDEEQKRIRLVLSILKDLLREVDLINVYKLNDTPANQRKRFVFSEFPSAYLNQIVKLAYPEGYVACFMDDCTNAAAWGHYGDGHKGVCLKFKTKEVNGCPAIDLKCTVGWGNGPIYGYRPFLFRKIDYSNQFPSVDFFKSLGRLPGGQLMRQWYTDKEGNTSQCANHIKDKANIEKWRKGYWDNYDSSFYTKTKDWEHEKEYRLFLGSVLDSFHDLETRKLQYKFEDLEAVIFGMRTTVENKVKIIKIIESKCKANKRDNFDFYQAGYSPSLGKMQIKKMDFISLKG